MDQKRLKELQTLSNPISESGVEMEQEFIGAIKTAMDKRGYRSDLTIVAASTPSPSGKFPIQIRYKTQFEYPSDTDLTALAASVYDGYNIDWTTAEVDTDIGLVTLVLEPSQQIVPIQNLQSIPPEFVSVGTGIFKRKADASGNVEEIWELRSDDTGLSLVKRMDDVEITETEASFSSGDVVNTPDGVGRIQSFDEVGNAIVQIGSKKVMVAATKLQPYSIDSEKSMLQQYYTELYGAEFAKNMVEKYGDR